MWDLLLLYWIFKDQLEKQKRKEVIKYVANFINKGSNINGSFGSNKSFLGRLIKGVDNMFSLVIQLGNIIAGTIIAKELIEKFKKDQRR